MFFLYILFFLILIFSIPVGFRIDYKNSNLVFIVRVFFFDFNFSSNKSKNKKNEAEKFEKRKKESNKQTHKSKLKIWGKLKILVNLSGCFLQFLKEILKKISIKKFNLKLKIGGKDAVDCARNYGIIMPIFYGIKNFLPKKIKINIMPDFLCEKIEPELEIFVKIFPYYIFFYGLIFLFKCTRIIITRKLFSKRLKN
ncbi:MAG: hypothetical protein LBK29_02940 [Oscillospiraceae bacterium]|nr:hypothetical protein [Oscillospiraceae bacterium]